ncbi:outer membrane protein assembly factor [Reichenbachiella agarivorans]|uniref:Outer membrane protein assembly factor n=1 Tax=Reichenbachiella agarivorans TaxID=2979464 RepID=A0ABY6CMK5_9BACT|nr:outer membrane protein assembly factor [Reichenbachiella agarivorans]UXP30713.1 outer membrane protein assembly factor [Reichenbachiella agarivorans]
MKKPVLLLLLFSLSTGAFAQSDTTQTDESNKLIQQLSFVPLPVIAANPAMGWMFGLAPAASWMMGPNSTTHRSSMVSTFIYTTKKQFLFTLKSNVFTDGDKWNLLGDWRYFVTSQPTYGLGTGSSSSILASTGFEYDDGKFSNGVDQAQMMKFNYLRFHETALKRIGDSRFFAGLGYHLDYHYNINDQLLDLDTIPPTFTSHYAYSIDRGFDPEGYVLSGISVNALFDSRDNAINPYSGRYGFASLRMNPEWLGSDQSSSLLWLEYRDYFNLSQSRKRHLIGVWTYGNFVVGGDVPYMDLPAVGWDQFGRSGRAYPQGRFRGEDIVYGEVEYRVPLQADKETFGAVVFLNATTTSNTDADIQLFDHIKPGYGVGLRIMVDKNARTNLSLDYGFGADGAKGFYLNVNETF